jgi:uncharacterized protein YejL (UPF0352 family)
MLPAMAAVYGYGQQWNLGVDQDEEDLVALVKNHKALYDKLTQAMTNLADNFANWGSMTAQQKDAANRQAQRVLANLVRMTRGDLSSGGV